MSGGTLLCKGRIGRAPTLKDRLMLLVAMRCDLAEAIIRGGRSWKPFLLAALATVSASAVWLW